jgi:hypothetical protein
MSDAGKRLVFVRPGSRGSGCWSDCCPSSRPIKVNAWHVIFALVALRPMAARALAFGAQCIDKVFAPQRERTARYLGRARS